MTTPITIVGNATADPELKFGQSGKPWASFTVAVTPREKQQDGSYGDGPSAFYRVACFGPLAENVAESVQRGTRVVVAGTLKPREFEHNGEKRMSLDVAADHVGVELRFATVSVTKAQRQSQPRQPQGEPWGQTQPAQQTADPWGGQTQQQGNPWGPGGGGMPAGTGPHDEPPFAK